MSRLRQITKKIQLIKKVFSKRKQYIYWLNRYRSAQLYADRYYFTVNVKECLECKRKAEMAWREYVYALKELGVI